MSIAFLLKGPRKEPPAPKNSNEVKGMKEQVTHELEREAAENLARSSLAVVMELLPASVHSDEHDDEMVAIGMSAQFFMDPLTRHEVQILGCALFLEKRGKKLTYGDILRLTDKYNNGQAMVVTMVYKTLEKLTGRGMLVQLDERDESDNRSRAYEIRQYGKEAFRMAVMNSRVLYRAKDPAAA